MHMFDFIFRKRKKILNDLIEEFNQKNKFPGHLALMYDNTIQYFLESSNLLCLHWYESDDYTYHKFDTFRAHLLVWQNGKWYVKASNLWSWPNPDESQQLLILEDYLKSILPAQQQMHADLIEKTKKYHCRCRIYEDGTFKLHDMPIADIYKYIREDIEKYPAYAEYISREMDNEIICYHGFLSNKTAPENLLGIDHRMSVWTCDSYFKKSTEIDKKVFDAREELIRIYDNAHETNVESVYMDQDLLKFIKDAAKHAKVTIRRRSAAYKKQKEKQHAKSGK